LAPCTRFVFFCSIHTSLDRSFKLHGPKWSLIVIPVL
jgi:hypothetical protein